MYPFPFPVGVGSVRNISQYQMNPQPDLFWAATKLGSMVKRASNIIFNTISKIRTILPEQFYHSHQHQHLECSQYM